MNRTLWESSRPNSDAMSGEFVLMARDILEELGLDPNQEPEYSLKALAQRLESQHRQAVQEAVHLERQGIKLDVQAVLADDAGTTIGDRLQQSILHDIEYSGGSGESFMRRPIRDLQLNIRARKCCIRLGITTIGELVCRSADELLEFKDFGEGSLTNVRGKLAELRLKLRCD